MIPITCFLTEQVIRDAETNKTTAINLLESMHCASFPLFMPSIVFYASFRKDTTDPDIVDLTFRFEANGKEIATRPQRIDFRGEGAARTMVRIFGFTLEGPGSIRAELKDQESKLLCSSEFMITGAEQLKFETMTGAASGVEPEKLVPPTPTAATAQ